MAAEPVFFAFFPKDFAGDALVEAMSTTQVGAYILLLCKAWQHKPPASLPNDDAILARYARLEPHVWSEVKAGVLAPFSLGTDGRWHQKRLRQTYEDTVKAMAAKSKKAADAANARWRKAPDADAMLEHCTSNASASESESESDFYPQERKSSSCRAFIGGRCAYCDVTEEQLGKPHHRDHFFPSHAGGKEDGNIVVACHYCNHAKSGRIFSNFEDCRTWLHWNLWAHAKKRYVTPKAYCFGGKQPEKLVSEKGWELDKMTKPKTEWPQCEAPEFDSSPEGLAQLWLFLLRRRPQVGELEDVTMRISELMRLKETAEKIKLAIEVTSRNRAEYFWQLQDRLVSQPKETTGEMIRRHMAKRKPPGGDNV